MLIIVKKAVAQKRAKRRNQKIVNGIHRAHRAATLVNQVIQAVQNLRAAVNRHLHQVNFARNFSSPIVYLSRDLMYSQLHTHPSTHHPCVMFNGFNSNNGHNFELPIALMHLPLFIPLETLFCFSFFRFVHDNVHYQFLLKRNDKFGKND